MSTPCEGKILIVDDDRDICELLSRLVGREGLRPIIAHDGSAALDLIPIEVPDILIVDIMLPGISGLEVMQKARLLDEGLPVILITGHAGVRGAVDAIKAGAHDYLAKPFLHDDVMRVIHRALNERRLKRELRHLSNQVQQLELRKTMGTSDAIKRLTAEVNCVAKTNFTVVILGETGTGKEVVARAIHQASARSKDPFLPVDCGAIPETLLESELFGYEKGAFTGANAQTQGKFEMAKSGTLFLDEITNMPLSSQAKLLRVLQEKVVYRVGGTKPIKVDMRLVAASNHDLQALAESDSFRSDLFFRLNEFTIKIPALRERKEDVFYLAKRFLDTTCAELNKDLQGFSEDATAALLSCNWPGNVRQLRSTIRRAALLADHIITTEHLDITNILAVPFAPKLRDATWPDSSLKQIVQRGTTTIEREVLIHVLRKTGGNKAKAARLLQIDYKTIHSKVKKYGIEIDGGERDDQERQAEGRPSGN
jgi:two-component system nitrogen regulation response regulator GlnG